jgi:hypothetical protein
MIRSNSFSAHPSQFSVSVRRLALALGVASAAWLLSGRTAHADLVFQDTYSVDMQTTDLDYQNSVRQSGVDAPLTYLENAVNINGLTVDPTWWQLGVPGYENWLYLTGVGNPNGPGGVGVSTAINHSFIESTNFTVDLDIVPFSNPGAGGWCGVKILDSTGTPQFVNGGDGFGMLINPDGDGYIFDGGTGLTSFPAGYFDVSLPNHVTLAVTTGGFDGSSSGQTVITVTVNGSELGVYTINHNYSGGYISLFYALASTGTQNSTAFGNLQVQSVGTSAPNLTIKSGPNNTVLLEWPAAATGFVLQTNSSLPGIWGDSILPITVQGNTNVVTDIPNQQQMFYRLSSQP